MLKCNVGFIQRGVLLDCGNPEIDNALRELLSNMGLIKLCSLENFCDRYLFTCMFATGAIFCCEILKVNTIGIGLGQCILDAFKQWIKLTRG